MSCATEALRALSNNVCNNKTLLDHRYALNVHKKARDACMVTPRCNTYHLYKHVFKCDSYDCTILSSSYITAS